MYDYVGKTMSKSEVCAVVATYNRKELLSRCIRNITSQKKCDCDVLVIDNGSSDGTEELFNSVFNSEKIRYINLGKNLGSAGSQAAGLKEAVISGYKYIWLMDDDVMPKDNTLFELMRAADELGDKWGILSSVAYWKDGSICKANRQKKTLFRFVSEEDYKKRFVPACMVSAASMFIRSQAIIDVGLPIAEYFFYTDDYEFSGRVGRKYPVYVVPASTVTHVMRENMKANIVKDTSDRMYRYQNLYRNDVHCYKQYGIKGLIYLTLKFIYTLFQILFLETKSKKDKMDILVQGYKEGMAFSPRINHVYGTKQQTK